MENAVKVVVAIFQQPVSILFGIESEFMMIGGMNVANKKKDEITIHSSAAEYLTYVAAVGDIADSMEMRYEDENIWLTQKMLAQLYDVAQSTINEHIKKYMMVERLLRRQLFGNSE